MVNRKYLFNVGNFIGFPTYVFEAETIVFNIDPTIIRKLDDKLSWLTYITDGGSWESSS